MTVRSQVLMVVFCYYVIALLTGSHYYNHRAAGDRDGIPSVLAGFVWPLYWSGRAALWITK